MDSSQSALPTTKSYIVIGGASGMGLATVHTLLNRGAQVAVSDTSRPNLDSLSANLSPTTSRRCLIQPVDVTDKIALHGFFHARSGTSDDEYEYEYLMNLNVRGLFNVLSTALVPGFLGSGESVVHVESIFSQRGFRNGAAFAASRYAALGMVRSAAIETQGRVRVNHVLPGVIDTPMHRANLARVKDFTTTPTTPIARDGTAQEVANVVASLLSEESSFVTGNAWNVDGGANC
ncbi:hypothetical protein N7539_006742 [Penicillium diatomitis]|uniref:Uncharacterized protein n=1 Tax=Penicillium diatomitis TaxID=2819901 RepID=A0A9X0BSD8_9EURO|nr:uncharacterized protein N7539_006742 [Penicillium diatomitis]KAJ5480848.1 hypothetical protein N7539_006742 [Penicillium diatomitis]